MFLKDLKPILFAMQCYPENIKIYGNHFKNQICSKKGFSMQMAILCEYEGGFNMVKTSDHR